MSSSRNDPRCETDPALTEPWIDVLGKALAGGIPRRRALKLLVGTALASVLGITAGCGTSTTGSNRTPTPKPNVSPSPTPSAASACPPEEQELCCTVAQLQACEIAGSTAFTRAISGCEAQCSNLQTPSADCQTCFNAVVAQSLQAYTTCTTNTCLVLVDMLPPPPPSTPTPAPTATALQPVTVPSAFNDDIDVYHSPLRDLAFFVDAALTCNHQKVANCRRDADHSFTMCLLFCLIASPACVARPSVCVACVDYCYARYGYDVYKCIRDDGCPIPHTTYCTSGNVCCPLGQAGCGSGVSATCCDPSASCCGGVLCLPSTSTCCTAANSPTACAARATCCVSPSGSGSCCPAGTSCCQFTNGTTGCCANCGPNYCL